MTSYAKILVLGSGGREHALAVRLLESESVGEVVVCPGNPGTRAVPARLAGKKKLRNASGTPLEVARVEKPDLVVVGPEEQLDAGVSDAIVNILGIPVFGPTKQAARIELSKAWAKAFMGRHDINTARHVVVRTVEQLDAALDQIETPVIKVDSLTAGVGVYLTDTRAQARRTALELFSGRYAGSGVGEPLLILEERLSGFELSVHAISDGERFVVLPYAQDHKRIGNGDTGGNTGGMGAYAPVPFIAEAKKQWIAENLVGKAIRGLAAEGIPFVGLLYAGIMVPPTGDPVLLEYNARFGDPEAQAILNVVDGDFARALDSAARGALDQNAVTPASRAALCVVLAARGYPGVPHTGGVVTGIERAEALEGVRVYHAGTRVKGDALVTGTGRVLGVTGVGATIAEAASRAYAGVKELSFPGMQFRDDIGARALRTAVVSEVDAAAGA
jgi:phosphoribosylamine---glycine ligase